MSESFGCYYYHHRDCLAPILAGANFNYHLLIEDALSRIKVARYIPAVSLGTAMHYYFPLVSINESLYHFTREINE